MEKIRIGSNYARIEQVYTAYDAACEHLNQTQSSLKQFFPEYGLKELFEFVKSATPRDWLSRQYGASRQDDFPAGTDVVNLVKHGFLTLPQELVDALNAQQLAVEAIERVKQTNYFRPFQSLYDGERFDRTGEFDDQVEDYFSTFTTNPEQNQVLELLESIAEGFNELHRLGALDLLKDQWLSPQLKKLFSTDKKSKTAPVEVHLRAFSYLPKQFKAVSPFELQPQFNTLFVIK